MTRNEAIDEFVDVMKEYNFDVPAEKLNEGWTLDEMEIFANEILSRIEEFINDKR